MLDCPPVLNEISAQVVRAADCVIVPLPPSPLSARAFELVASEIRNHAKTHPPILLVLSMLDMRRNLHREARPANPNWPATAQAMLFIVISVLEAAGLPSVLQLALLLAPPIHLYKHLRGTYELSRFSAF